MKSKDGHQLFQAICLGCNKDRGWLKKRQLKQQCRSCSARKNITIACQNAVKARLKKNNKVRQEYTHINFDDFIVLPCGIYKYKTLCKQCKCDKGYQILANAYNICRTCYYEQNASQITDTQKRLKKNFASNLYHRLKLRNSSKMGMGTFKIMSYTVEALAIHLESKFQEGMSWNNYGSGWHIDHIIPDSWFTYSSIDDQSFKDCWSLSNLQPLWAIDNIRKSNKFAG